MLSQQDRIGRLTTPLAADMLCLVELSASEGLSQLFDFDIVAVSESADIDMDALIGKPFAVEIEAQGAGRRWYHGLLTEGEWNEQVEELSYYRLRLQPWPWLLTKTEDCRIHHDKTVVDIIRDTFADHGLSDYKLLLTHPYPILHYTVQYNETDWNFVCRLMELHGIYYFFEHSGDGHTLVLADGYTAHAAQGAARPIQFNPSAADALLAMRTPYVARWSQRRQLRSGRFAITDYNHLTPNAHQYARRSNPHAYANGRYEVFGWPGPHVNRGQGEDYVKVRAEAEEALDKRRLAQGIAASLYPGALATLTRHARPSENGEYLAVNMESRLGPQTYRADASSGDDVGFSAEYEFQPSLHPFRAPPATPKPLIHSMQTATVVGAENEEIDCDDHGRILVHFFWDRHDDRSCRVRVSQVWGGQTWGGQIIPRIGMEVMVAYLEGDPDRPIVVGCVPNPKTLKVPHELPINKTKMTLKSKTYKLPYGFNELYFDDMTLKEEIYVHAEKDFNKHIEHNESKIVDNNSYVRQRNNLLHEVGNNSVELVNGNKSVVVGVEYLSARAKEKFIAYSDMFGFSIALGEANACKQGVGNYNLTVDNNKTESVHGVSSELVGGSKAQSISKDLETLVGRNHSTTVNGEALEEVNLIKRIHVGQRIELICGDSRIIADKDGNIAIVGKNILLKGSNSISIKAPKISMNGK